MFGIGIPELILILIVGLIVFGPSKLPEIGRAVGKGLREFRKASSALQAIINAPEEPPAPKPPAPRSAPTVGATESATRSDETFVNGTEEKPAAAGYDPPTQESVRAKLEEQQKSS